MTKLTVIVIDKEFWEKSRKVMGEIAREWDEKEMTYAPTFLTGYAPVSVGSAIVTGAITEFVKRMGFND